MAVVWKKCGSDSHWCSLDRLKLEDLDYDGVYIIWFGGNPGLTVRIGNGNIKDRLGKHRKDKEITAHAINGDLKVTWAAVPSLSDRKGIESFLADRYPPLVGERFPDVDPIRVNLPFG